MGRLDITLATGGVKYRCNILFRLLLTQSCILSFSRGIQNPRLKFNNFNPYSIATSHLSDVLPYALFVRNEGICYITREKTGGKAVGKVGKIGTGGKVTIVSCILRRGA